MAVFRYIFFVILCAAVCRGAGAEEPHVAPFLARPVKDGIYVRLDSSVRSALIATLSREDTVRVIEAKYDWYKVVLPERIIGAIHQDYVATLDGHTGTVTAQGVNIRNKPQLNSPVIGSADENDPVLIRGKEGEWYLISVYPYGEGWVYRRLLKEVPAEEQAPAQESGPSTRATAFGRGHLLWFDKLTIRPERVKRVEGLRVVLSKRSESKDGRERFSLSLCQPRLTGYELTVTNFYPQGFGYLKEKEPCPSGIRLNVFRDGCTVEGTLKRNMHTQWCAVPYAVTSDGGVVFLNGSADTEALLNKKVRLTGHYVIGTKCVYVEAHTIEEK